MALRLRDVASVTGPESGDASERLSHADLVDRLTGYADRDSARPDLALLAYALPDENAFKTVATHLNKVTGGEAHSLALTGDGLGTPFTAVGIADAYQCAGQGRSPLIAIVECSADAGLAGAAHADLDSGVLLNFDTEPGDGVVELVRSSDRLDELAADLAQAADPGDSLLVVLGPETDPAVAPEEAAAVHRPPAAGTYCTSVWLELARHWTRWAKRHSLVALCATDPVSGTSHLAVLRNSGKEAAHA